MTHDPLCPALLEAGLPDKFGMMERASCRCTLIARVREDERDAAIEAVWSVMEHSLSCYTTGEDCLRCEVTGAIESLGGER